MTTITELQPTEEQGFHPEVEMSLDEAHRILDGGIALLSQHQEMASRDHRLEDKIARAVNASLENLRLGDYLVGISRIQSLGMRTIGVTSMFNPTGNSSLPLQTVFEDRIEGQWLKGLIKGDKLGYPIELGKDWYLVFWGEGSQAGTYYAPVTGIKEFTLKPYYCGF